MSDTPSQQSSVYICDECGKQKQTASREVTFSSALDGAQTSTGSTITRAKNFFICHTPGCIQRKRDRWKIREWELRNDPTIDNSPEYRAQEKQRINEEEERFREDAERIMNEFNNKNSDNR